MSDGVEGSLHREVDKIRECQVGMMMIVMMIMMISGTSVKVVVRGRCRANTPVRTGKPTPAYSWWVLLNTSKYCIVLHKYLLQST